MAMPKNLNETAIKPHPDFDQLLHVLWRDRAPDYVPFYELFVNVGVMATLLGKPISDRMSTVEFYHKAGYDYVPVWPRVEMKVGSLKDTSSAYPITDRCSFETYAWPEASSIGFEDFAAVVPVLPAGMKIIGQTSGIFEKAEELCGYAGLCYLLNDDRGLVGAIFERIGTIYETIYAGMAAMPGVGALVISDDMGFKTQTLISPDDLRKFVLPWHKKLARIAHGQGLPCILHSCGQLSAIMEDLIDDVGVDAKHSYEDAILPVMEAKHLYGDRIAVLGGFDVDRLCGADEAAIRRYVTALIDVCGTNGGYALGSGNSITDYVPVDHYLTMLDEGWCRRSITQRTGAG